MCGLAGIVEYREGDYGKCRDVVTSMVGMIRHRGPDFVDVSQEGGCTLGHTRLSILDLDERSNQPFRSANGRYDLVFNGEVYNYVELRQELREKGVVFRTDSDTEVISVLWERMGSRCLKLLNGMFAFAIYDKLKRELFLARDRFGVKPLFIHRPDQNSLVFCSEINPLVAQFGPFDVNASSLVEFLHYGAPLGDATIYSSITQLPPGHFGVFSHSNFSVEPYVQWDSPRDTADDLRLEEVRETLAEAVKRQCRSDVPFGLLLSGGIDSSALSCLAASISQAPLKTFTAAFEHAHSDEREQARLIADYVGSDHTEIFVSLNNASGLLDIAVNAFGQPFGDPAALPLLALYREMASHVKVVLQGDGGDELFGGYDRYVRASRLSWLPRFSMPLGYCIDAAIVSGVRSKLLNGRTGRNLRALLTADRASYAAKYMDQNIPGFDPLQYISNELMPLIEEMDYTQRYQQILDQRACDLTHASSLIHADRQIILPDVYLPKVDRTSMQYSLEARVPFLDNEVQRLVSKIGVEHLVNNNQTKNLLRTALSGIVPSEILKGKKKGFGVPVDEWMKFELGDELMDLSKSCDLVNRQKIERLLRMQRDKGGTHGLILYKLLVLCKWHLRAAELAYK